MYFQGFSLLNGVAKAVVWVAQFNGLCATTGASSVCIAQSLPLGMCCIISSRKAGILFTWGIRSEVIGPLEVQYLHQHLCPKVVCYLKQMLHQTVSPGKVF